MDTYRNYLITVDVSEGIVKCPALDLTASSIASLKSKIDAELKNSYQPVQGIMLNWNHNEVEEVTITRPAGNSISGSGYVWVKHNDGKRTTKEYLGNIYAIEAKPELKAYIKRVRQLQREMEKAEKIRKKLPKAKLPSQKGESSNGEVKQ